MAAPRPWAPIGPIVVPDGQVGNSNDDTVPISGRVSAIAFDGDTVYIGAAAGGAWKSSDAGLSWQPLMDTQQSMAVGAIAVAANGDVYVGTGEDNDAASSFGFSGTGLLRSQDHGQTWALVPPPPGVTFQLFARIVVDPHDPEHVWVATDAGLFERKGGVWTTLASVASTDVVVDFTDPAHPRVYGACFGDGVYGPDDKAGTWGKIPTARFDPRPVGKGNARSSAVPEARIALAMAPSKPSTLYAAFAARIRDLQNIFRSDDGGQSWVAITQVPDPVGQTEYNFVLAVHPDDPNHLLFGETQLWLRKGIWNIVSHAKGDYRGVHADQHAIAFHPTHVNADGRHDEVWVGNDGGVFVSFDGGRTFAHRNRGLQTLELYSLSRLPYQPAVLHGGTQDNGSLRYLGHPVWHASALGDAFNTAIDPHDPRRWYAIYVYDDPVDPGGGVTLVQRSTSGGNRNGYDYAVKGLDDSDGPMVEERYVPIVPDPLRANVIYLATVRVYRSDNGGDEWTEIFHDAANPTHQFSALAATSVKPKDPTSEPILYVATKAGDCARLDHGPSGWTPTFGSTSLPGLVRQIAVDPNDPNTIFLVVGSLDGPGAHVIAERIWRGTFAAGKLTLTPLAVTRPNVSVDPSGVTITPDKNGVNTIVIDADPPRRVYIGCDYGVFVWTDGDPDWKPFDTGLPRSSVTELQLDVEHGLLRAATAGRGVWERPLTAPSASPPTVDLCLRDTIFDIGLTLTPETMPDPLGSGATIRSVTAPDIKLDVQRRIFGSYETPGSTVDYKPTGALDFIGFEALAGDRPRAHADARVYLQVHNRGSAAAAVATVRLFWALKGATDYPPLPDDFWTAFPAHDPSSGAWTPVGPAQEVHDLQPAQPQVLRWDWSPSLPSDGTIGIFGVVTCPEDPVSLSGTNPLSTAQLDKHVALKELELSTPTWAVALEILITLGAIAIIGIGLYEELHQPNS